MMILKNLKVYENKEIAGSPILFLKDEEGNDWYESQKLFDEHTLKIVFDSAGVVVSFNLDVSKLWPINNSVTEVAVSAVPENLDLNGGWVFDGSNIVQRKYTAEEWLSRAEKQRQTLLTAANVNISDWRTELQLEVITEDDKSTLIEWMAYIKELKAIDLSSVTDEASFTAIDWPIQP